MKKLLIIAMLKIRWAYFHISPFYIKFTMDQEAHFQHTKTGAIHSDYTWVDKSDIKET